MRSMFQGRKVQVVVALVVIAIAAASWSRNVRAAVPAGGGKVAIVSIQDAIATTDEGKVELDKLSARFKPKQDSIQQKNAELDRLKKEIEAAKTPDSAKIADAERKQKALQRDFEDAQNEFQKAEQDVVNRLGQKMLTVLDEYGKSNGYSVILDVSSQQTPVLWASQDANITKELIAAYNAKNPATPAASKPAAPSATKKK